MARYLIQATHTPEQCLQGLDEALAMGAGTLASFDFGCAVGDHSNHVCYTSVEAASPEAARAMLPGGIRAQASVTEVGKFTPEQIQSYHAS